MVGLRNGIYELTFNFNIVSMSEIHDIVTNFARDFNPIALSINIRRVYTASEENKFTSMHLLMKIKANGCK